MIYQRLRSKARLYLILGCFLFSVFTQFGAASNSEIETSSDSAYLTYLPDCTSKESKRPNLFIVSTFDGKISIIDAIDGSLKWSKMLTQGPLLSSSIGDFIINNKGEIVRYVPSLDGHLFVHNGRTIKQTPFSTEKLLKSSLKFSENVLLVGGQENKIIGLNLKDGSIAYECGFKGCSQHIDNMTFDDVVLLKKVSQSVRAVNSISGQEEWHFVVNNPEIVKVGNEHCHNDANDDDQSKFTFDIKVIVPCGYIYTSVYHIGERAPKQLHKEWDIKFGSPLVNVWHYEKGKLNQINLFSRETTGIKGELAKEHLDEFEPLKLLNEEPIDEAKMKEPDFYIGSHNNQLYIQKSPFQKASSIQTSDDNVLSDMNEQNTGIVQVKWKQPTDPSSTPVNNSTGVVDKFEISTKLSFPFSNKLNSVGYYIFKLNNSIESNKCERITDEGTSNSEEDSKTINIINEIVYTSLFHYWKEIIVICLISWVVFSFLTLIFKNYIFPHIKNYLWPTENEQIKQEERSSNGIDKSSPVETIFHEDNNSSVPPTMANTYNSRYLQDFDHINVLGSGAFGVVFEAKHKIDEVHYAVKRVTIPAQKEKRERFMREIRALSKLNHNGIVGYFNAWIEEPPIGWQESQDKLRKLEPTESFTEGYSFTDIDDDFITNRKTQSSCSFGQLHNGNHCLSNDSLEIIFEDSGHKEDQEEKSAILENALSDSNGGDDGLFDKDELSRDESTAEYSGNVTRKTMAGVRWDDSVRSKEERVKASLNAPRPKLYVYIQMQLCKKETLKDWLFQNTERDKCEILNIFTQLVEAVHYVHSNKLIHRDLKPSNIFFSMDRRMKIGDFGLVTNTQDGNSEARIEVSPGRRKQFKHTNDVGTKLYMSPEQVKNEPYNHKVDIFSMGIILYELLQPFNTESERIITLKNVRNKLFSREFMERHTKESKVLEKLLSLKPDERPEANDLLSEDIFDRAKQAT